MTQHAPNHPDPVNAPQFYSSVPIKRFIAWIIDTVITVILSLLIVPFTAFTGLFFLPLLFLVVGFGYRSVTIGASSATFGMRMMSIELRDARGERFDFSQALMHTLGFTICTMFFLLQVLSAIMMLGTARGQGLPDMVLGSVMINRR
ncbi:RDD family protein [Planktotalea sp.]|uniref:RDD family protein n=1 Tax=Planktotalea sp. TaxID=2029877 RepID=UPI00329A23D5